MKSYKKRHLNEPYWDNWLQRWFVWLLIIGVSINITGLFVTILEPDGALYAMIAKTMAQTGDFINLKLEGKDWLDKPHFPFWIGAISFKIFGINGLSYKLPALLFWAAGGLYTYLFTKELYSKNVALLSVLIYITAAHLVISNNDVRAEPYLTGLIIGSVYHFYKASHKNISIHLFAGSLLAACAVMTKGPFVLIIISSGFIIDWILQKKWKEFTHYRWWLAIFLIFIFILPEIYCLYQQFDLHPKKVVFGQTGVSGIRFFFWESQFGRFLNTGPIKGKGDPLFYFHTLLWAFLPWSLLLFTAIFHRIKDLRRQATNSENITIATSLVTFLLFSLSRFQLPHYMNIVFPFFSIITAQYLYNMHQNKIIRFWYRIQTILFLTAIVLLTMLAFYFNIPYKLPTVSIILALGMIAFYAFGKEGVGKMMGRNFMMGTLLYGFLNLVFYPALLNYQSGSEAAKFINQMETDEAVCTYDENSYSFAFYLNQPVEYYYSPEILKNRTAGHEVLLFTHENELEKLVKSGISVKVLGKFPHFHISQLTGKFLNYKTRGDVINNMVVGKIIAGNSTN